MRLDLDRTIAQLRAQGGRELAAPGPEIRDRLAQQLLKRAVLDLSTYKPTPATLADANQIANGLQAIQNVVNAIDNLNFAAGKIFDPAKLMQNAATDGQGMFWDDATSQWKPASTGKRIADVTLGADTASFDIQNIPASFAYLRVVVQARGDAAATSTPLVLRFNNDSGANYDSVAADIHHNAIWTSAESLAGTSIRAGDVAASTAPASAFDHYEIIVPNYAGTTAHKSVCSSGTLKTGTTTGLILFGIAAGWWRSTAAINRITVLPGSGNFKAGSRVTIFGEG